MVHKVIAVLFSDSVDIDDVVNFLGSTEARCIELTEVAPNKLVRYVTYQAAIRQDPGVILLVTDNLADDAMIAQLLTTLHNDPQTRFIPVSILCSEGQREYQDPADEEATSRTSQMRSLYFRTVPTVRN